VTQTCIHTSMYGYVHFYIHLSGRHINAWVCRSKYKARHYEGLGTSAPYSVARILPPPPLSCIWLHDACHRFLFVTFPKCRRRFRNPISATICMFWRENDNCDGGCTIPGLLTITKVLTGLLPWLIFKIVFESDIDLFYCGWSPEGPLCLRLHSAFSMFWMFEIDIDVVGMWHQSTFQMVFKVELNFVCCVWSPGRPLCLRFTNWDLSFVDLWPLYGCVWDVIQH
jgi:hypothetical protein